MRPISNSGIRPELKVQITDLSTQKMCRCRAKVTPSPFRGLSLQFELWLILSRILSHRWIVSDLILPSAILPWIFSPIGHVADLIPPSGPDLIPPLEIFESYSILGHWSYSTIIIVLNCLFQNRLWWKCDISMSMLVKKNQPSWHIKNFAPEWLILGFVSIT